ncbi:hypothetical protein F0562_014832 [Nyssa sinensis]|uniref:DUF7032 domain-containing protein n=1 Tax=Nyssa sinensis TaxID=561372 RepID=A0A5J4ZS41_9ASTE|nr:hypothetical protein F0562_014832 [Nyssa sinensis]
MVDKVGVLKMWTSDWLQQRPRKKFEFCPALVINLIQHIEIMVEDSGHDVLVDTQSAEEWFLHAQELVPMALEKAREVKGFPGRWKMIISKLEQIPSRLSDLSSHPCFSKNALCKEQLQIVSKTLNEAIELAELCVKETYWGKLRMQSDLDALSGKLDLNLRDCGLLIKTRVLGEVTFPSAVTSSSAEPEAAAHGNIRELLARLQIGHLTAKHRALDNIVEVMKEDEKNVLAALGRSNIAALVQLLTATSPQIREKTVTVICSLAESGSCENWLVSEGVLPPLIRLVESGNTESKEKATISLQRLSMLAETARSIVGHGGVRPLIEICSTGDSVSQAAAACTLKNISAVPEVRQTLAEEGIVKVMINLLDCGILLGSKEYAAECLQNLTSNNDNLRRSVVSEGGIRSLLTYLDGPLPQESACWGIEELGAQQAAASTICRVCSSTEMKKLVGEAGCIPLLVKMLEAKTNSAREVAVQAISSLVILSQNCRGVKRDDKSVPNLVQLLDPSPQNTAKKYAVSCLASLSSSKKCKRLMISYGAIGYLKKLSEMDIPGAKKLLKRLSRDTADSKKLKALKFERERERDRKRNRQIKKSCGFRGKSSGTPPGPFRIKYEYTRGNQSRTCSCVRLLKGLLFHLFCWESRKMALLSTFLFLDQIVWLGRTGIYKNKERVELIGRISLFCWMGSSICTTLVELGEGGRLSASMKKLEKDLKNSDKYKDEQYRSKLQKSNERSLALIKSVMDIVVAVGLLQLAPKKVTPRVTGAFGFVSSLISCYQLLPSPQKSKTP